MAVLNFGSPGKWVDVLLLLALAGTGALLAIVLLSRARVWPRLRTVPEDGWPEDEDHFHSLGRTPGDRCVVAGRARGTR
jgi:hypothetical protein